MAKLDYEKHKSEFRCKISYLPTETGLELMNSSSSSSSASKLKIKDVCLWFQYRGNVDFTVVDDLIMDCFDKGDYPRDELKEAVTTVLTHPDTVHFCANHESTFGTILPHAISLFTYNFFSIKFTFIECYVLEIEVLFQCLHSKHFLI